MSINALGRHVVNLNTAFKITESKYNIKTRSSKISVQIPQVKSFGKKNTLNYTGILAYKESLTEVKYLTSNFFKA